jgi:hypothetical protein
VLSILEIATSLKKSKELFGLSTPLKGRIIGE